MNTSATDNTSVTDLYEQGIIILTVSCTVNLILSVPANGYVLWLIVNGPGGTMANEFFGINLAVSEILFCLCSVFYVVGKNTQTTLVFCLGRFGLSFLLTGRPLFQSCVCVERYLAVVHPVTFLKYKPLRYRVWCCTAIWLVVLLGGLFFSSLSTIYITIYNYALMAQDLILIFVMFFCCLSVLRALEQPRPGEGDRDMEGTNIKMRAFKIVLIILVSMLVCYLPVLVNACLYNVIEFDVWFFSYSIVFTITLINGFVQPLLFLHRARKLPCGNTS